MCKSVARLSQEDLTVSHILSVHEGCQEWIPRRQETMDADFFPSCAGRCQPCVLLVLNAVTSALLLALAFSKGTCRKELREDTQRLLLIPSTEDFFGADSLNPRMNPYP